MTVTTDLTYDQRMQRICLALQENGYHVTIVGRLKRSSVKLKEGKYIQKRLKCYFEKGKLFYFEYNLRLLIYLFVQKFDILCSIDLDTIVPGYIMSKLRRKPLVYDAHEYFTEIIEIADRPLVKKVWTWIEGITVPNIKYAYTVSKSIQKILEDKYHTPFITIRNLPILKPDEVTEKGENYLIYAGVVNQGRGLEPLIEAMKHIEAKLYICGDGDILNDLKKNVNGQGLQDKVLFFGYVEPLALEQLIKKAYIGFLLLENIGLSYYYSLANKFFDYMHAGIPQVTINFPEYVLINDQFKIAELINLDVQEIIGATNKLLNDKDYYSSIAENTRSARQHYNWQSEKARLIEFYNQIS